jgi:hypothetical protein
MEPKLDIQTAKKFCKTLFSQKVQWERRDLIAEVAKMFESSTGASPTINLTGIVKKALDSLYTEGYVQNIGKGLWAISQTEFQAQSPQVGGSAILKIEIPLQPVYARKLIRKLFEQQSKWDRTALVEAVVRMHTANGNTIGNQVPTTVVKKTLTYLQDAHEIKNVGKGIWEKQIFESVATQQLDDTNESPEDSESETEESISNRVVLGEGSEYVYLYYYENDKKIAEIEGRDTWDCKIGFTTVEVDRRVYSQSKTARARKPVIALVIQTDYAAYLEDAIHASLKFAECYVSEGYETGIEWFDTNPKKIIEWYKNFMLMTQSLKAS